MHRAEMIRVLCRSEDCEAPSLDLAVASRNLRNVNFSRAEVGAGVVEPESGTTAENRHLVPAASFIIVRIDPSERSDRICPGRGFRQVTLLEH